MKIRPYPDAERSLRSIRRRISAEMSHRYRHFPQRAVLGIDGDELAARITSPEWQARMRRVGQTAAEALGQR